MIAKAGKGSLTVVRFDEEHCRAVEPDRTLLGSKGANLVELCRLGLPVPPGFILGTDCARKYHEKGRLTRKLIEAVHEALEWLQETAGRRFGSRRRPLLLAVRSGAPDSMPGMMDTILNIGLNDDTVEGLERSSGNPRFAWDSYRRLITMYGDTVLGVPRSEAEQILQRARDEHEVEFDWELDARALADVVKRLRNHVARRSEVVFPQDPEAQLFTAIEAVFSSWNSDRSRVYREMHDLEDTGTAVTVQAMVFGNSGGNSGSGVAFSRDPSTGENSFYSEFIYNAQGEDVVSGARSPDAGDSLQANDADLYRQLRSIASQLEQQFRDMQDIEFTVEDGRLFILQARNAKRSPLASLRTAVDMAEEGVISRRDAVARVRDIPMRQLRVRRLAPPPGVCPIARGTVASVGVAVGHLALDPTRAIEMKRQGKRPILVREETRAEDLAGMEASVGLLTARGGRTSHAAVVARQLGLCCVVGCQGLEFLDGDRIRLGDTVLEAGQPISLDGGTGRVYALELPVTSPVECAEIERIGEWSRELGLDPPFSDS